MKHVKVVSKQAVDTLSKRGALHFQPAEGYLLDSLVYLDPTVDMLVASVVLQNEEISANSTETSGQGENTPSHDEGPLLGVPASL